MAQSLIFGLLVGALYGLAAVGLSLVFGVLKYLNVAHGELLRAEFPEIREYEIIVERKGAMDEITLRVEPQDEMESSALANLASRLSERLKIKTNLRFNIKFTLPGDLPRYTLKSRRFKDLRGA